MNRRRGSVGGIISIAVLFIVVLFFNSFLRTLSPKPPIEVTEYSLDPSSVKPNKPAELHISIKNLDHKTHQIKIIFETGPRIMIFEGAESLLLKTDQGYQYTFSIESEDPDAEKIFIVKSSLEEGASMVTYPITMNIFVNGTKINADWDDIELTVKR